MEISQKIKALMKNELFIGSLALLILTNTGNVFSYLFQFFMARMLEPADYGILAVLTSICYIFSVPTSSIQTVVSRYTTQFNIKKELGKIKGMLDYLIKKMVSAASIVLLVYLFASIFISGALDIPYALLMLNGLFLFGAFLYPVGAGVLQGMKKFGALGSSVIANNGSRFIIALVLVILGFGVYGAVTGTILGMIICFVYVFPFIKEITNAKRTNEEIEIFSKESYATFFALLLVVFMYSLDVFVVKGLFAPEIAGKYAVISMIGKIVLFSSLTVGNAMFPISSEKFMGGSKRDTRGTIKKASLAVFALCFIAVLVFALFPKLIISVLFGSRYSDMSGMLIYVSIAFSFISFLNLNILYKVSISELKVRHVLMLALLIAAEIAFLLKFSSTMQKFGILFMILSISAFVIFWVFSKYEKN